MSSEKEISELVKSRSCPILGSVFRHVKIDLFPASFDDLIIIDIINTGITLVFRILSNVDSVYYLLERVMGWDDCMEGVIFPAECILLAFIVKAGWGFDESLVRYIKGNSCKTFIAESCMDDEIHVTDQVLTPKWATVDNGSWIIEIFNVSSLSVV